MFGSVRQDTRTLTSRDTDNMDIVSGRAAHGDATTARRLPGGAARHWRNLWRAVTDGQPRRVARGVFRAHRAQRQHFGKVSVHRHTVTSLTQQIHAIPNVEGKGTSQKTTNTVITTSGAAVAKEKALHLQLQLQDGGSRGRIAPSFRNFFALYYAAIVRQFVWLYQ